MAIPILLIPGTLCDERVFEPLLQFFPQWDVRTLALPPVDSISAMAQCLLTQAPPRFALVGLSLGGIIGLEIAAMAPQRLAGLALLGANARAVAEDRIEPRRLETRAAGKDLARYARETLSPLYAGTDLQDHAGFAKLVVDMAMAGGPQRLRQQTEAALTRADSRPRLGAITAPTAIIGGMDDRLGTPDLQRELADGIPGASLTMLRGVGHLAPVEAPEAVAAALREWAERIILSTH